MSKMSELDREVCELFEEWLNSTRGWIRSHGWSDELGLAEEAFKHGITTGKQLGLNPTDEYGDKTTGIADTAPVNGYVVVYQGCDGWAIYTTLEELINDQINVDVKRSSIFTGVDRVFELGKQVRPVSTVTWKEVE